MYSGGFFGLNSSKIALIFYYLTHFPPEILRIYLGIFWFKFLFFNVKCELILILDKDVLTKYCKTPLIRKLDHRKLFAKTRK